jgi:regulator of protease activity HflC (stomatin/prohibitin superfamily)
MKTIKRFAALALIGVSLAACSKVPAGNVGVKVNLLGSGKGVDQEVVGPGRYFLTWNEELYLFPTFTQNYVWTKEPDATGDEDESISFQTREGLVVNADVGISYSIRPDNVADIFQKYRRSVEEITDIYLRNMVRDALVTEASRRPIETVYGPGKAELMVAVEARVRGQVEKLGINVERIYWVGDFRLPGSVITSINSKIEATQRAQQRQNEVAEARAEADKKIEAAKGEAQSTRLRAEAEAEANKIVSQSLTPALVQYRALERWTGELPRIIGGEGAIPFVNVDGLTSK